MKDRGFSIWSAAIDLIALGAMTLVISLGVVTICPAATALYYSVAKSVRRGRGGPYREYFRSFRENFRQGAALSVILALFCAVGFFAAVYVVNLPQSAAVDFFYRATFFFALIVAFLILAVAMASTGVGVLYAGAVLCSSLIISTFAYDDRCDWTKYAMVMPVSRKELVAGKYVMLALMVVGGSVIAFLASLVSNAITGQIPLNWNGLQELIFSALTALIFALVYGSVAIPLILRFGAEQGRVLLVAALLVPAAVCLVAYQIGKWLGIVLTDQDVVLLVCGVAVAALVWVAVSYRISCSIFAKQELS